MTGCFKWERNSQLGVWSYKKQGVEYLSRVWFYEHNFELHMREDNHTINKVRLKDQFLDIQNPTKQELLMFHLQYGIDLTIPLTSKENHNEQNN